MFRFGRTGGEGRSKKNEETTPESDDTLEVYEGKEWLDSHPLDEEDIEKLKREEQRTQREKKVGGNATRKSMWDLPDWYK